MSDTTAAASQTDSSADLRGTLIKRLAVAGLLVAVLLAVLAFFDYLAAPEEPEPTIYTRPVPVPPKKEVTQPVKPATALPETPPGEAEPEKPAEPPAKPMVPAQPAVPETQAEAKPAPAVRPAAPAVASAPAVQPQAARPASPTPMPETTAAPKTAAPSEIAPTPSPAAKPAEVPAHPQPPVAPRLFSGYVLQAGVFSNVQRAEELHAKLTLNGIPSTLEARVQVGPFKSKAEADAAREKMQSLGIDPVLIPPKGVRR